MKKEEITKEIKDKKRSSSTKLALNGAVIFIIDIQMVYKLH